MNDIIKKAISILGTGCSWFYAVFCFLLVIGGGFSVSSLIFLLSGIAVLPIKPIKELWAKIPMKKVWLKPLALFVAFFIAILAFPTVDTPSEPSNTEGSITQTEYDSETESDSETEIDSETEYSSETESSSKDTEIESEDSKNTEESEKTENDKDTQSSQVPVEPSINVSDIPAYSGKAYVALNNNYPSFPTNDLSPISFEYYSDLDSLGRCGVVFACIGQDIMPTEERGSIGSVKPTGWHTVKYDIVDGKYLYNRCHLIGYQLTGENANEKNLITGTRQLNIKGMLPLENLVADYVKETGNHVMYKVTPVFEGNNLLAKGVQIEAYSIEDNGAGVCFNVFAYNVQDGININYTNGESSLIETKPSESEKPTPTPQPTPEPEPEPDDDNSNSKKYAVNSKNGKIHMVGECSATGTGDNAMTDPVYFDTYEEALEYSKRIAPKLDKRDCGNCW